MTSKTPGLPRFPVALFALVSFFATASPGAAAAQQDGAAAALARARAEAAAAAEAGDYVTALDQLDAVAEQCKDHAPFFALRGEWTLALAKKSQEEQRKDTNLLYHDAVASLRRAVELDGKPVGPRVALGQALLATGEVEAAAEIAVKVVADLPASGGDAAVHNQAHALCAGAAARAYSAKKAEKKNDARMLDAARASFRALEKAGALDADLLRTWAATEQWAEAPAEAVGVWVRALQRTPDADAVLGGLVDTAAAVGKPQLAVDALASRRDATGRWYLGRARYLAALVDDDAGKHAPAIAALDRAHADFAEAMQLNPAFRDSCEQWIAMCLGKKANVAFRAKDFANAEKWSLEAVRQRPDRIDDDLGGNDTIKLGVLRVADVYFQKRDLARVEAIYRAAAEAAHQDLDLLNNAGLFARDYGNQLERAGKKEEARAMYEQSYNAYGRAQALDPNNVRLCNDLALIAIHYLERDWDRAKELLQAGIAIGQRELRERPPADERERKQLEEAVGDCFENLALWQIKHGKDLDAGKAAAEESLKYHPGRGRPGARRHLQAIEKLRAGG